MKNNLLRIFAAAATIAAAIFSLPLQASHMQGVELTYSCIAPNTYVVNLKLYRDCTGAAAPTSATLNLRSPGCNNGRNQPMTKVSSGFGNLYCPQIGNVCSTTGRPNYEEAIFTTTVTFSAAEAQCSDWTLSWTECCRPNIGNVNNAQSNNLYAEAFLKLSASGTPLNNSSPQFKSLITIVVNKFQPVMLSHNTIEADGDSLVYSLKPALNDATTPVNYGSFNSQGSVLINPTDSTQIAFVPAGQQSFSPTFPIPSYQVDWTKPAPRYATQYFQFNSQTGSMMFTPSVYHANSSPVQGLNKYVVVVQVDEYRKINGNMLKIGSVRRDMLLIVEDCGPNRNPDMAAPVFNGQAIGPDGIIHLRPGIPLSLTFAAGDPDQADVVHLESDVATILTGAVFIKTTGNRPTGTLTWTPTTAHVRDQPYFFNVEVTDNACPVKGVVQQTYGVRVSNNGGVTGISKSLNARPTFMAFPNPFASEITFKVNQSQAQQHILIYNVLGQQVDQVQLPSNGSGMQQISWDKAGQFPKGTYLARLISEGKPVQVLKFIKE